MTQIQYIDREYGLVKELDADIVPKQGHQVLIDDDQFRVHHIAHTIDGSDHVVTVICDSVDDGSTGSVRFDPEDIPPADRYDGRGKRSGD